MDTTTTTKSSTTTEEEPLWNTRDAVKDLFLQRDVVLRTTTTKTTTTPLPPMSNHFDVETCLARIRRDKPTVVRVAFETAACTVLHALSSDPVPTKPKSGFESSTQIPLIQDYKTIQQLRITSLKRAHENKEVVSRNKESGGKRNKKEKSQEDGNNSNNNKPTVPAIPTSLNTPASSAAALDARSNISRAILCVAGNLAFDALTPGPSLDVLSVPQNNNNSDKTDKALNLGAVLLQAQTLGDRTVAVVENASRRSKQRHDYRIEYFNQDKNSNSNSNNNAVFVPSNPFVNSNASSADVPPLIDLSMTNHNNVDTPPWTNVCLPRLVSILHKGAGHAVYCDLDWNDRHGRMAHLLQHYATVESNFGPHLIVTTQPHVQRYAAAIQTQTQLNVLPFVGNNDSDKTYLSRMHGLANSKTHVVVTSYKTFLEHYLYLCQVPYQIALLDQGVSWLSMAQADSNGSIAALWESGVWSSSDAHVGLAGTSHAYFGDGHALFDSAERFYKDASSKKKHAKGLFVGLTARYRIMTMPPMQNGSNNNNNSVPSAGLLNFLLPHFSDVVREEWDRSRIMTDAPSMEHFLKLATRAVVVYDSMMSGEEQQQQQLAMDAVKGKLVAKPTSISINLEPQVPALISEETFVADGKVTQSRRSALSWLGPASTSWLRYELGSTSFQNVLKAMKQANAQGQVCEEIVTASSTTASGAGGAVSGTQAYRLAVRCGRNFGSEQGLRQHMAALHAPPGTWLCRTCSGDCGTSQARTHHERSCGQPSGGNQGNPAGGGISTVGQGVPSGKKNKTGGGGGGPSKSGQGETQDKDKDGSFRVPNYRGVWVNPAGKHFIKIQGDSLKDEKGEDEENASVLLFDSLEEAARKHDEVIKDRDDIENPELNFNADGTRIVHQESAPAGRALDMLGGDASSVVPALSVINIKDLPNGVKPLLRDPRQTSRTGGNSKRHVYAYRGVCRQARKGHDRWQSQISFGGTNHYLGTFDSEWDAAAIYAWAHLILYGEEATKQAQKEGEEAAAAYEQEKKDIAAGKIVAPPPKPAKKKATKKKDKKGTGEGDGEEDGSKDSKKRSAKDGPASEKKKPKVASRGGGARGDTTGIAQILAKGAGKVPVLTPRKAFQDMSDEDLAKSVLQRVAAVRGRGYCVSDSAPGMPPAIHQELRPCAPISTAEPSNIPSGCAMLLGLSGSLFAWNVDSFIHSRSIEAGKADIVSLVLNQEYGRAGVNERFRTVLQGSVCLIGRAGIERERTSKSLGLGSIPLGGTCGELDCNIGGVAGSCSEVAAVIQKSSNGDSSDFQFFVTKDTDVVSLNGRQVRPEMGSFPLFNEDICTVGARVFVFLLPMDA